MTQRLRLRSKITTITKLVLIGFNIRSLQVTIIGRQSLSHEIAVLSGHGRVLDNNIRAPPIKGFT
jgi:hypothetical protein